MPKRKWDEEELRKRVLELRRKGKSYREIAREIGCSVFTVSKVLSPFENPQSRLRQVAELAMRVEELSRGIDELARKLEECRSRLEGLKPVEELRSWLSRIEEGLSKVESSIKELRAEVKGVASRVDSLDDKMGWIERSAALRLEGDKCCKYIDKDGYCMCWALSSKVEGWDVRRYLLVDRALRGEVIYHLNVKRHPLICVACPNYKPKG
jgi:predicted nuclease with TOPRIM domain